jgi:hypothetical protein
MMHRREAHYPVSSGEVAERLKAAVSKTVVGVTPPGVQIPPSPPVKEKYRVQSSEYRVK